MTKFEDWKTWGEFLFMTYKRYRNYPGWDDLTELHDDEDNEYWDMLDDEFKNIKAANQ